MTVHVKGDALIKSLQAMEDTLPRYFWRRVAERGDKIAMREKTYGIWRSISWKEYGENARAVGCGFAALGLRRGEIDGEQQLRVVALRFEAPDRRLPQRRGIAVAMDEDDRDLRILGLGGGGAEADQHRGGGGKAAKDGHSLLFSLMVSRAI